MDRAEYERRQTEELARQAKDEGAWYYDPESPVIWKRYIIGPVSLWRRVLWWFFPPSHAKMLRILQRRTDKMWDDATRGWADPQSPKVRVIFAGMVGPVILSGAGPLYYGYVNGPYFPIIVWALACTIGFLWTARSSFKMALSASPSIIKRTLAAVTIVSIVAVAFVVGDTVFYSLAQLITPYPH
jgi:hypothetical protein